MAFDRSTLAAPFTALAAYDWAADATAFATLDAAVVAAHGDAALRSDLETRFAALLGPATSRAAKEYVCRKLSMIGTEASVPALAPLLADADNSHMARFALERIAAPAAADAIRGALANVTGDLKIGMISSLASRRDAASVPLMAALLTGEPAIAVAAASGLGRIATPEAAAALAAAKVTGPVADAVTDARLACADVLLAKGDRAAAKAIFESINTAVGDAPQTRRERTVRMAARSGLFAALDETVGRPLLLLAILLAAAAPARAEPSPAMTSLGNTVLAEIATGDADMRAVALDRVRHGLAGEGFTRAVTAKLPSFKPAVQADTLLALADRGDAAAVPAAMTLLASATDPAVRAAAILLLGRLGGPAAVPVLVKSLSARDPEQAAARRALVVIGGPESAAAIVAAAGQATAPVARSMMIEVIAERRDRTAMPLILAAALDGDSGVRQAALRALGMFGGPDQVRDLAKSLLRSSGDDRKAAELALVTVCTVNKDGPRSAEILLEQFASADEAAQEKLLPALARVGGPQVMEIIDGMIAEPAKRQQGLEALAKWPDATVQDRLLDLVGAETDEGERDLLLGALIRIAPLPDNKLKDPQKLELLKKTMALCRRTEDKARVLERANAIRTLDTFRFVVPYLDDPALTEPACRSVVELAHHQKLRDANKDEFLKALDKVLVTTKNEELVERATRYKAGQTWDRKKKGL
ncbi:MAG: HEAT repeat domain-containing protein [Pirellulales bacterium]